MWSRWEEKPGCYLEKSIAVREKSVPGWGWRLRCVRTRKRLLWLSRGWGGGRAAAESQAGRQEGGGQTTKARRPLREESFDVHFKRKWGICLQCRSHGSDFWVRKSPPGGGHSNLLQHPYLENPMDRGAWRATAYGVTELGMTAVA